MRGRPTEEELAALLVVLTALACLPPDPRPTRSRWSDPAHSLGLDWSRADWRLAS